MEPPPKDIVLLRICSADHALQDAHVTSNARSDRLLMPITGDTRSSRVVKQAACECRSNLGPGTRAPRPGRRPVRYPCNHPTAGAVVVNRTTCQVAIRGNSELLKRDCARLRCPTLARHRTVPRLRLKVMRFACDALLHCSTTVCATVLHLEAAPEGVSDASTAS